MLSSLLHQPLGGAKAALKRTAFADVSNTAASRGLNVAKDDSNLYKKAPALDSLPLKPLLDTSKSNASIVDTLKQPAALLRPAQRPLSTAAAKVALASTATAPSQPIAQAAVPNKIEEDVKPAKTLSKKQTTIFRDTSTTAVVEPLLTDESISALLDTAAASSSTSDASSLPAAGLTPLIDPSLEAVASHQDDDLHALLDRHTVNAPVATDDLEVPALSAADLGLDLSVGLPLDVELVGLDVAGESLHQSFLPASLDTLLEIAEPVQELQALPEPELKQPSHQVNGEQEEYWDVEEEEEEYYDADGYTTARSIRSRADTTGGLTVLMEPRVTARVERELAAAKQYVDAMRTPEDIEDEAWDTSMVAEYGDEIFEYMRNLEQKMKPNPHYMENQTEIQWSMRAVLIDWLVQVHHRFTLLPETLFLAINYIDRFLSCKVVSLGKLQLVGATAIFVAAKYEEINCPSVQEIIFMVDGGYTMDEVLKAERFMLSMLQFELGWPGPMSFLRRISKADDYDLETRTLAKYFLEVTVMDERFVGCAPSFTAAGAHCLARLMLRKGDWVSDSSLLGPSLVLIACAESPTRPLFPLHILPAPTTRTDHLGMLRGPAQTPCSRLRQVLR